MSIKTASGKTIQLNDRTMVEICTSTSSLKRLDMIQFCWMLRNIGVDLIEINHTVIAKIKKLPKGLDYIFRVLSLEDVEKCVQYGIKNCVLDLSMALRGDYIRRMKDNQLKITVETTFDNLRKDTEIQRIMDSDTLKDVACLRVRGSVWDNSSEYIPLISRLKSAFHGMLDFCPENRYYNATAIAVETIMNGGESITVSFMGYGNRDGYAALEEVYASINLLMKIDNTERLKYLPELSEQFSKLTGIPIPYTKPIISKGIFKFESGIHADGIRKNPATYEPFEPEIIGQERELIIGKHSGSRSVMHKLNDLGIHCKKEEVERILKIIRERSIQNKSHLNDQEIRDIIQLSHIK